MQVLRTEKIGYAAGPDPEPAGYALKNEADSWFTLFCPHAILFLQPGQGVISMALTREDLQAIKILLEENLQPVHESLARIEERLQVVEERLQAVEERLQAVEERLGVLEGRGGVVEKRLGTMGCTLKIVLEDLQAVREILRPLNDEAGIIKRKINELDSALEHGTNRNILLLTESMRSLIDRLTDKTVLLELKMSSFDMKVRDLERELADIKDRLAQEEEPAGNIEF